MDRTYRVVDGLTPAQGLESTAGNKAAYIEDVRALRTEVVQLRKEVVALRTRLAAVEQAGSTESYDPYTDDDADFAPPALDEVASQAEQNEAAYQRIEEMLCFQCYV